MDRISLFQEHVWSVDRLTLAPNNLQATFEISGPLALPALKRALAAIVERHEVLRTRVRAIGTILAMELGDPSGVVGVSVRDVATTEVDLAIAEEARHTFDVEKGPLWRCVLLRVDPERHLFVFTAHHIVFDGISRRIFERELIAAYGALVAGRAPTFGSTPMRYADFARLQRAAHEAGEYDSDIEYWMDALRSVTGELDLPADRPRGLRPSGRAEIERWLSPELVERVRHLARLTRCSPYITYLAALSALAHRLSGQTPIAVGSPVSCRDQLEAEGSIGYFVNELVFVVDSDGAATFRDLLTRTRRAVLAGLEHRNAPFDLVLHRLGDRREGERAPLHQLELYVDDLTPTQVDVGEVRFTTRAQRWTRIPFGLEVNIDTVSDRARILVGYDAALFDAVTIERVASRIETILTHATDDPDGRLSSLSLDPAGEPNHLIVNRPPKNGGFVAFDIRIATIARRSPDAVALVHGARALTFGDLEDAANRVAWFLKGRGVGRGTIVGIAIRRSIEQVIAMLAVAKAGAAWLPLEPDESTARHAWIVEDAAPLLIVDEAQLRDAVESGRSDQIESNAAPDDIAYLVYTSGSTGRPKGVLGLHRGVSNRLGPIQDTWPFACHDIACQITPLAFVDAVAAIFAPLVAGRPLILIEHETVRDPELLVDELSRRGVTRIVVVPSFLNALLSVPRIRERLSSLQLWMVSGERLSQQLAARFFSVFERARLVNIYGSSEVSADVTAAEITPAATVTIGRPLPNCRVYVLDADRAPCGVGVVGEIFVGGACVSGGYLHREELTAERFLADPFVDGERMVATGDRGRWRSDGELDYLGRADRQVKIRGVRIELGDVEAQLSAHPDVREAALVLSERSGRERELLAFVVAAREQIDDAELRGFLRERIPSAAMPARFVRVPKLSRTPSGKLDRTALASFDVPLSRPPPRTAPSSEDERMLAAIWSELLQVEPIGRDDDLFAIGGHSLVAGQIVALARHRFGLPFSVRALFQHPTIRGMAAEAARLRGLAAATPPAIVHRQRSSLPLLPNQRRTWAPSGCVQWYGFRREPADPDVLDAATRTLVERHALLRARLAHRRDGAQAITLTPPPARALDVTDLRGLSPTAQDDALSREIAIAPETPFDLENGPLWRLRLIRCERGDALLFIAHRAIADARSLLLFLDELEHAYGAIAGGREPALPALAYDAFDYAAWHDELAAGPIGAAQRTWWAQRLAGARSSRIAPERQRSAHDCESLHWQLSSDDTRPLREACTAAQGTPQMGVLAAWIGALRERALTEDVVVAVFDEGRRLAGMERLFGPFVQTLPIWAPESHLTVVREALLEARDHADLTPPIIDTSFGFNHRRTVEPILRPLGFEAIAPPEGRSIDRFDVNLGVWESSDGELHGRVRFRPNLVERATIERLLDSFAGRIRHPSRDSNT